ncbi:hypothetical protein BC940DRAFT_322326 [Gongronella butleri]|nr:hypothetical protein BC940DRAFT_322326 [Gongronella butleri]
MCVCGILFNIIRIIHAAIVISDAGQSPVLRLFIFDLCWVFAFSAFTCYVFGVSQTLLTSNRILYEAWVTSPRFVDAVSLGANIAPVIFMNLGSIGSGVFAAQSNIDMAYTFLRVGYYTATVYTVVLGSLTIIFGRRLLTLMSDPILVHSNVRVTATKLHTSAIKVKITVVTGAFALWGMGVIASVYASVRVTITTNYILAMLFSGFINFVGPAVSTIILGGVFVYPKLITGMAILTVGEENTEYPRVEFKKRSAKKPIHIEVFPKDSRFTYMGDDDIFSSSTHRLNFIKPMAALQPAQSSNSARDASTLEEQTPQAIYPGYFSSWAGIDAQTLIGNDDMSFLKPSSQSSTPRQ